MELIDARGLIKIIDVLPAFDVPIGMLEYTPILFDYNMVATIMNMDKERLNYTFLPTIEKRIRDQDKRGNPLNIDSFNETLYAFEQNFTKFNQFNPIGTLFN
jgi:hypothetical protein